LIVTSTIVIVPRSAYCGPLSTAVKVLSPVITLPSSGTSTVLTAMSPSAQFTIV
jgi:hypothetical protein